MRYLLDTNVVSEWMKPAPSLAVVTWLDLVDEDRVFLSVVTSAEIRPGSALLGAGRRRSVLEDWLRDTLPRRFQGRLLGIDEEIAVAWADLTGANRRRGIALSIMDGFIAATARVHDLSIVTRNLRHFKPLDLPLVDPWAT